MNTFAKIRSLLTAAERKSALALFFLMLVGMLLETLGIGLIIPVITLMMQSDAGASYPALRPALEFLSNPTQVQLIVGAMLSLVGIYLVKNSFLAFLAWRQTRFAFGVQVQLSQRLFAIYLRQPYTFHLQRNSAHLIRNIQGEMSMFINSAVTPCIQLFTEGLMLIGLFALLLYVEPLGTLVVFALLGVTTRQIQRVTKKHIAHWGQARLYHEGMRIKQLHQGLGGVKDVKLLGRESDFLSQYGTHTIQSARMNQLQTVLQQMPRLWLESLAVVALAILVFSMIWRGREIASILPTLALFAAVTFRLMPSANRIISAVQQLRFGLPVVNMLYKELNLPVHGLANGNAATGTAFVNELEVRGLSYTYIGAARPALNSISLLIKKGESIGFIGASGSGKSTLVDVMLGLLPADTGEILIDGKDINANLRAWQDQIGYVPQSIYLIDDTLRRNVAFGLASEQINDEAVQRAIKAAQLEDFVDGLPDGIDTVVGERGVRLSGGQRQRIGIARALYHDPAVLVLDEATSALDTATEQGVMSAVTALHGSKTILIVAHRLSTVEHCDRLYQLEQGRVVAEGTPSKLLPSPKIKLA